MKVSSIEQLFDNRRYKGNNWNSDFDDLPFDDYESFIARQRLYSINDITVFSSITDLIGYA